MSELTKVGSLLPERVMPPNAVERIPAPVRQDDVCPHCKGAGFLGYKVPFGHPLFGKAQMCSCRAKEIEARAIAACYSWLGMSPKQVAKLESMTFRSFNPDANGVTVAEAYKRARAYAKTLQGDLSEAMNCFLIGPYGNGKTHLACAIMNAARANGIRCLFVSGNDLFQALYSSGFDEHILQRLADADLICFDDMDKMQIKEDGSYQKSTLFTLFNQRLLAERPTIITANAEDDWGKWLHPAVLSRLLGNVEAIAVQGQDYRLFPKEKKHK